MNALCKPEKIVGERQLDWLRYGTWRTWCTFLIVHDRHESTYRLLFGNFETHGEMLFSGVREQDIIGGGRLLPSFYVDQWFCHINGETYVTLREMIGIVRSLIDENELFIRERWAECP